MKSDLLNSNIIKSNKPCFKSKLYCDKYEMNSGHINDNFFNIIELMNLYLIDFITNNLSLIDSIMMNLK